MVGEIDDLFEILPSKKGATAIHHWRSPPPHPNCVQGDSNQSDVTPLSASLEDRQRGRESASSHGEFY